MTARRGGKLDAWGNRSKRRGLVSVKDVQSSRARVDVAPRGFTQDPDNGSVWWGKTTEGEGYVLQEAWVGGEGRTVHVDVDGALPESLLPAFIAALAAYVK